MEDFEVHIWINNFYFGNKALVVMLSKNDTKNLEELSQETFLLKKKIRNLLNETKNGTTSIIVDINKISIVGKINNNNGSLLLRKNNDFKILDSVFPDEGRFKCYFLNYVHCPDQEWSFFKREIAILNDNDVFKEENLLNVKDWEMCKELCVLKKYRKPYVKKYEKNK